MNIRRRNYCRSSGRAPCLRRLQEPFNLLPEKSEIPDVLRQYREGKGVIDCSIAVDDDIPDPLHRLQALPHLRAEYSVAHEVLEYILVGTRDAEAEVCVLDGLLDTLIDAILYDAEPSERLD